MDEEVDSLWSEYPQLFSPVPEPSDPPPATDMSDLQSKIDATLNFLTSYLKRQDSGKESRSSAHTPTSTPSKSSKTDHVAVKARKSPPVRPSPPPPSSPKRPLRAGYHIRFNYDPGSVVRTKYFSDGTAKTYYRNGAVRTAGRDGTIVTVHGKMTYTAFVNGDRMQDFPDGANAYMYASNGSIELRLPSGESVIEFSDGRREIRRPNGTTTIHLASGRTLEVPNSNARENR